MNKRLFGRLPSCENVYIYRLTDGSATAEIMEYGAAIVSFCPFGDVDVVGGVIGISPVPADGNTCVPS